LYDVLGRVVAIPVSGYRDSQDETINLGNLPSGVYFYQIKAGDRVETKKLVLLK
jgi:hypothetical protein